MLDEKDLQAIAQLIQQSSSSLRAEMREQNSSLKEELTAKMDVQHNELSEKISHMQEDIDILKEDVADIKEKAEVTRSGFNMLLDWADDKSIQPHPILSKKAK